VQDNEEILLNARMLLVKEVSDAPEEFQLDPELGPMVLDE